MPEDMPKDISEVTSDILLKELSNADIDWLVRASQQQPLAIADVLVSPGQTLDFLYLVLEGSLRLCSGGREIARRSRGELIGEGALFNSKPVVSAIAASDALLLAIPQAALIEKLQQDISFAAHFYRALALMMSEQIRRLFKDADLLRYQSGQMVTEALFVFGELHDSDIDWMLSTGQVEKLMAEKVLLHIGRPVDALYTVLAGQLAITTTEHPCDPLANCSHGLEAHGKANSYRPIAYLSRGGLPGITSFLDFQPLPVRFHAVRESLLLAIPRHQVVIKLQTDLGFAARFYRVIATQLSQLLTAVSALGDMSDGRALTVELEDELDLETLQRTSQGAIKFDWMLKRLRVGAHE
jgi:bacteriocin-type transport-associated protein